MKKLIIRSIVVLLILIIVGVVAVGYFLGDIVKKGVETYGPQIAKVSIKLDSVNVSLFGGAGNVKGLEVGNPEGYKALQAIKVGSASASVSPGSLLSDKIVVRSIRVESPEINFEGGLKENNLTKILDNVNAATGGSSMNAAPAQPGKKIQVDDLLSDIRVNVSLTGMGGKSIPLVIPKIHLTDVGKDSDGITAADLSKRVLHAVVESVTSAVASNAAELGKRALETGTGAVTNIIGGGLDKAKKGIGDLFKKKE